jgi:hypothetical protein
MNEKKLPALPQSEPVVRDYTVRICDACYELEGEMCHTPGCLFCRCTMGEVGEYLDRLMIRPVVDGERLRLEDHIATECPLLPRPRRAAQAAPCCHLG